MLELLALPAWRAAPRTIDEWVAQLKAAGGPVTVTRESAGVSWIEIGTLRLRGYVMMEGQHVDAINFELTDPDPSAAIHAVEVAAEALGWEVHPDDGDDDDDDDE
jgi:hypothetical protein